MKQTASSETQLKAVQLSINHFFYFATAFKTSESDEFEQRNRNLLIFELKKEFRFRFY